MEYVNSKTFTTKQESIKETIQEISDVIVIAKNEIANGNSDLAIKNLHVAQQYLATIGPKVDIALTHVPNEIKEKNCL
jgi:hypothetical protein